MAAKKRGKKVRRPATSTHADAATRDDQSAPDSPEVVPAEELAVEPAAEPEVESPEVETDDPVSEQASAEESPVEEPPAEETSVEETSVEEPPVVDTDDSVSEEMPSEPAPAEEATAVEPDPPRSVAGAAAWKRLLRMGSPRPTKANLLSALLAVLLGVGIATQVQLTNSRGLEGLSQSDLVRVLDDLSVKASRLDDQARELEDTRDRLKSGTGSTAEAIEQAQKRVDTLGILAGVVGAHGPGIRLSISDPDRQITGPIILDLIQELRDAGAEAIEVGGVRVVASTFIGSQDGEILVDGHVATRPFVIKAIGNSKTLASAMNIPGGIVETVRQKGASASVTEVEDITITSIHQPTPLTHAVPAD